MSDRFDLPDPDDNEPPLNDSDADVLEVFAPWDTDPEAEDPDAPRQRHDGFTEGRKAQFLKALAKTGCITEACRRTGVSTRSVYRHQMQSDRFLEHCHLALRMSATPLEITAWQRAVEGVEEEVVVGGRIMRRTRYSEGLLRTLLQGADPKKYGARQGFKRKRLLKQERKQIEREVRAEYAARTKASPKETTEALVRAMAAVGAQKAEKKLEAGWTRTEAGDWIPPGYGLIAALAPPEVEGGDPLDSVRQS